MKFKMPKQVGITGRSSTITNAFVNTIIPHKEPTKEEVTKCLEILELDEDDLRCAYCNEKCSEWDHLRPIVENKEPSGYISNIYNLIPSCGKCNQSKGNKHWLKWIKSDAPHSPKSKKVKDLDKRIDRLEKYEEWGNVKRIDFKKNVNNDLWKTHWKNRDRLLKMMRECQSHADKLRHEIEKQFGEN